MAWRLTREIGLTQKRKLVQVLDPIPSSWKSRLLIQTMRLCNLQIEEAEFFVGHLKTGQGESVWSVTLGLSAEIAFKEAETCLIKSKTLEDLNKEWGRNTIQLFIAERIFDTIGFSVSGTRTVLKVLVADALSRGAGSTQAHLILGIPAIVTQESNHNISC